MNHKLYFEEIIEGSHEYMVVSSKVTPATKAQIKKRKKNSKLVSVNIKLSMTKLAGYMMFVRAESAGWGLV